MKELRSEAALAAHENIYSYELKSLANREGLMKCLGVISGLCSLIIALAAGVALLPSSAGATAAPACANLATDPQFELKNNPVIKSVTSTIEKTAAPDSL